MLSRWINVCHDVFKGLLGTDRHLDILEAASLLLLLFLFLPLVLHLLIESYGIGFLVLLGNWLFYWFHSLLALVLP